MRRCENGAQDRLNIWSAICHEPTGLYIEAILNDVMLTVEDMSAALVELAETGWLRIIATERGVLVIASHWWNHYTRGRR